MSDGLVSERGYCLVNRREDAVRPVAKLSEFARDHNLRSEQPWLCRLWARSRRIAIPSCEEAEPSTEKHGPRR